MGQKGISNSVEDVITARDILLAKETGARLHLCHCSTADSVRMVREAKDEGLKVTAEVARITLPCVKKTFRGMMQITR